MLADYIAARLAEADRIPAARADTLRRLADHVVARREAGRTARLTFICTHNSRRSHLAQIWARVAADHFAVPDIETHSGGIEATALAPGVVDALRRAGLLVERTGEGDNPVYRIRYRDDAPPVTAFSKIYNHPPNPTADFCAVMTCAEADAGCPVVPGAAARIALPYADPKIHDGTDRETGMYDARCRQIAREMLYVFSRVAG
ncbi:protein-tyrosine-phosphatase [bacterium]|nr:protein-tyrosine-phosphatase [bacterium]